MPTPPRPTSRSTWKRPARMSWGTGSMADLRGRAPRGRHGPRLRSSRAGFYLGRPRGRPGAPPRSPPAPRPARPAAFREPGVDGPLPGFYRSGDMSRHRGFILISLLIVVAGVITWWRTQTWDGWEYIVDIVGKGDNMPIAGLIPIITFF